MVSVKDNLSNTFEEDLNLTEIFQRSFYLVKSTPMELITQFVTISIVNVVVLIQDFLIIRQICAKKNLQTPAHFLVVMLLMWDSIMLLIFSLSSFIILSNGGIWISYAECHLLYFFMRLFRGFQIGNFTLIAVEKALFIILPYKYEIIFETKIPKMIAFGIYILTSLLCVTSFFEPVKFLSGPLTCANGIFSSNNPYLTIGIIIRGILFFICILCLFSVAVFAAYFNRKEKRTIKNMTKSVQKEFFHGMLRNIAINLSLTCFWGLQWVFISLMNNSENKEMQGRIAAILYHCFVATVNPIMIRLCYKPIRNAMKRNFVSPTDSKEDELMNENMSINGFLLGSSRTELFTVDIRDSHMRNGSSSQLKNTMSYV
ncbi:OLFR [Mytilus coruscus]|uniref:OLFR n=1 Tax=Mytilus coruscus TaxID=42192 RepID=A0A6J8F0D5_MYTCO|nr:OLFR [Mytilus coruscus]